MVEPREDFPPGQPTSIQVEQVGRVVTAKVGLDRLGVFPKGADEARYSPVLCAPAAFTNCSSSSPPSVTVGLSALNAS